ncbi:MAG: hypothetical protein JZU52_05805 [Lamprocystis purpurea]|nr:hypothetical protein [Lamprocystis purpurea]
MDNEEAAALIIKNIAMIEEANRLLQGDLSEKVFGAIDQTIQSWMDDLEGLEWVGSFDFWNSRWGTYFGPEQWKTGDEEAEHWIASFDLGAIGDDDGEEWLTALLAARRQRIGFRFSVDRSLLNVKIKAWRTFASEKNQECPEIEQGGFQFEPREGTWFLPWQINADLLAETYVNDAIEDALDPLKEALERIHVVYPIFVELVESAQQHFGVDQNA